MKVEFAKSKAGHDKGKIYIIAGRTEDGFCFLTDGRLKPLDKPKRKRLKHIQPIYNYPELVKEKAEELEELSDPDIRRFIRLYEVSLRGDVDV